MNNYRLEGNLLARGGGGGSSSGGGGSFSGGSFGGSSYSGYNDYGSNYGSSGGPVGFWPILVSFIPFLIFFAIIIIVVFITKKSKTGISSSAPAGYREPNESEAQIIDNAKKTFIDFQKAWSDFDLKQMEGLLDENYFKKMTLELSVLKNYERQNIMEEVQISRALIKESDNNSKGFSVFFVASSKDRLVDQRENKDLFTDNSQFSEIWTFVKSNEKYLLSNIEQTTADSSKFSQGISNFAQKNNFYYDPDFGWLMMPTRGAIFGPAGFGNADINNHVIGYYKNKTIEFYSYEPKAGAGMSPFTVAQVILPKRYQDILVTEKSWYSFKPKAKGLVKVETESIDFNKKFAVWAADPDKATSFELLAPNFMEKIYALSFEVNIEVVDNVLYLYSPGLDINYQDMLEVLDWAFEEMKM